MTLKLASVRPCLHFVVGKEGLSGLVYTSLLVETGTCTVSEKPNICYIIWFDITAWYMNYISVLDQDCHFVVRCFLFTSVTHAWCVNRITMGPRKVIVLTTVHRLVGMYTSIIDHSSKDNDCHDMFCITVTRYVSLQSQITWSS